MSYVTLSRYVGFIAPCDSAIEGVFYVLSVEYLSNNNNKKKNYYLASPISIFKMYL